MYPSSSSSRPCGESLSMRTVPIPSLDTMRFPPPPPVFNMTPPGPPPYPRCAAAPKIPGLLAPGMGILSRFGLAVAAGLIPASFLPLVGRKLLRTPLATWGMVV